MKTKIMILGATCLALVFSAVVVASASAAKPEFVLKSGTFPVGFTSTSGEGTLETVGGTQVKCTADTNTGKILNAKDDEVTVTFTGCKAFGFTCTTAGQSSGTIKTKLLKSKLVYNVGKTKVLDLLYPATEAFPPKPGSAGGVVAEFTCGGFINVVVRGAVLGQFPTTNVFLHSTSLVLKQTKGVQEFTQYVTEGGETKEAYLESNSGSGFEKAGETTTDTITLEGTREVKIEG
ncbi:MAG: hypothetical protein H0X42_06440 [Solirubrobacterales bacterium]|nr:hypothetical protein [Solirubrobacterales bacterium]